MTEEEIKTDLKNINEAMKRAVDNYPDNVAIEYRDKTYTYKDLHEKILKFANALKNLGIQKGDHLGIVLNNGPEFVISFYACQQLGAVIAPIIKMLKPQEIANIAEHAELKVIILADDQKRTLKKTQKTSTHLKHVITVGEKPLPDSQMFWDFLEAGSTDPLNVDLDLDSWASLNYTSGTTGAPKGTIHTHRNYVFAGLAQKISTKMESTDSTLLVLPMYHIFGLSVMNACLNAGAKLKMLPGFLVQDCLKLLCDPEVSAFAAVPAMYHIMLEQPNIQEFAGNFSPNLKGLISGGAPLPIGLIDRMKKVFVDKNGRQIPITEGFGTTEDSVYGALNPWDGKIKYGTVGLPFPGGKIRVVDDEGNILPNGQRGEVVVQNPGVMLGYYKMEAQTKKVLKPVKGEEGIWYYTGDIGVIDEEGYLSIVDRKKDLIIVGGRNVIPRDVEEVLFKHPKISDVTVVGAPHPKMGETVRAIIVPIKDSGLTEEEVKKYCEENLADYKCPRIIEFAGILKKTSTGKVLKKDYRASFQEIKGD
ncbi:MAG: class I adenylate-forming enzyme family protein [Candidatus Helarchaeota archaeon]